MERVMYNVCGQIFTIRKDLLAAGVPSKLTQISLSDGATKDGYIMIDRPPDMFNTILTFYLTGDLHIPSTTCPGAFLKELEFWDINTCMLTSCCYYRLQCFLQDQQTIRAFRKSEYANIANEPSDFLQATCSSLEYIRSRVWSVVDYRERTLWSRIYFTLAFIMVLLSIFTLAYSTDPRFKRPMTNCERLELMRNTGMQDTDLVEATLQEHCDNQTIPYVVPDLYNVPHSIRVGDFPDGYVSEELFTYMMVNVTSNATLSTSTTSFPFGYTLNDPYTMKYVKVPNRTVRVHLLTVLDSVTLVFFTVDIVLRLLACPSILQYFMSIINIADAAALIGTYTHMLILYLHTHEKYNDEYLDILEYLQMLRSFRLFRIVKNVKASRVLIYSVRANLKDLCILMLFLLVGTCTFASFLYIFEDKDTIVSIPIGWYWAVITMTTVGYGDITPQTTFGRLVGCLCSFSGVLLFALTVPIFANHFVTLYQYVGLEDTHPDDAEDTPEVEKKLRKGKSISFNTRKKRMRNGNTAPAQPVTGVGDSEVAV